MRSLICSAILVAALALSVLVPVAFAGELPNEAGAQWRVEQPAPPPPEQPGVEPSSTPVSLGHIGDIEFWEADRGALITSGNGSSIPGSVWFYNGIAWRELSNKCGASDGRIAWAGPDEFWTVSDGRPGQALTEGHKRPPVEDNTLCHFAPGANGRIEIVGSYASVPFEASSYLPMHGAGCLGPSNCWFAGDPLAEPETGAFQLHWNGHTLEPEPYLPEGHAVFDMTPFEGSVFESLRLLPGDRSTKAVLRPPPLRKINPEGSPKLFEPVGSLPLYGPEEFSTALDYLRLSAAGGSLWAAAGTAAVTPEGSESAGVTVIRRQAGVGWNSVISSAEGKTRFGTNVVTAIAGEPEGASAWLGIDSKEDALHPNARERARVLRLDSEGSSSDEELLPQATDPHGPLGAASKISCPAPHDCWMATTQGWLLHLATSEEREHPHGQGDPAFSEEGGLITFRPPDEGVPQEPSDEVPVDINEEQVKSAEEEIKVEKTKPALEKVPLISHLRSKLVNRTTLRLTFRLAVKANVRLLAERHHRVVASTQRKTFRAGTRTVTLTLDPKRWPTKLNLQTHALAPLPTRPEPRNLNTVTTSFIAPARLLAGSGLLP